MNTEEYRTSTDVRVMLNWLEKLGLVDYRSGTLFSCHCAGRVLKFWRARYPTDTRPRDAVRAQLRWWSGLIDDEELNIALMAAHAAAWTAWHSAVDSGTAIGRAAACAGFATCNAPSKSNEHAADAFGAGRVDEKQWQADHLRRLYPPEVTLSALEQLSRAGVNCEH